MLKFYDAFVTSLSTLPVNLQRNIKNITDGIRDCLQTSLLINFHYPEGE